MLKMHNVTSGSRFEFIGKALNVDPSQKLELARLLEVAGISEYLWTSGISATRVYSETTEYDYTPITELLIIPDDEDRKKLQELLDSL